ncbi:putative bifunctional diguanylate cyclase/phosphodiesterase [Methylophaga sp. OBS4]|uniref:putative bifunctional diguanylate cyclase/phosphodiesterase n=1 Tax=Methylophaga sp. OBS4 TaxID=2991935 RepID=UPI002254F571|nr:bifunctional diguanylate cyclase/phosphodiesterase [Methylophaga sp. OBS4]MCX4188111.1 bifunctional diguanylate cyclase/phosphodiesterase [Methylophaga sp. OBS4]
MLKNNSAQEAHKQRRHNRSIKAFIIRISVFFSALGFLLIYIAADRAYQESVKNSTIAATRQIASTIFDNLYQLQQKDWDTDEVEAFITEQQKRYGSYQITLHQLESLATTRTDPVNSLLKNTVKLQRLQQSYLNNTLRFTWPLAANTNCLTCSRNTATGDVLAVVEVAYDVSQLLSEARKSLLINLVYLSPFPFLLSLFVIAYLNRRINNSVDELEYSIEQVQRVADLSKLDLQNNLHGFSELNRIYGKVEKLSNKMRNMAVDKDLLEFEIQMLEKFVITSEVVRDWREYISLLLREINEVMPVYNLFSIFKVDDEMFALELFWLSPPSDDTRKQMEDAIRHNLSEHPLFHDQISMEVLHHTAIPDGQIISLDPEHIRLQTKSLVLDKPKIGGIVGIGVHSDISKDSTRMLVTSSILSTLINVVGSVKAIYKYTKDLEYYATRDPLTDLHNQRIFWEMLDYEVLRATRHDYKFSILMIDLDNFKNLNDSYGHSFGDKALQAISDVMRHALRSGDFLARYGGDEFAVILPESDIEQAQLVAQRIFDGLQSIDLYTPDKGERVDARLSIGMSVYPDHADSSRDLFMFADNMMYKAKSHGKNRAYTPDENDILEVFQDINEKSLRISKAIKDKAVIPYFQPLVSTENGETRAVEVLCRIKTDDGDIMGAHEFIEIAEKMGIIHNLDFVMLEKALQQVEAEDYDGMIFINISPRSLVLSEFLPEVERIVSKTNVSRERIVFEITERDTVKNMTLLEKFVSNLKSEGFKLAVDDFGSGFSSFHYLKHFPIDFVKIDGEFVANMVNNPKDHAVVRCISNLAHELQALTIAEYVESQEVLDAVRAIGITYAQGYHIRRPTPYILNPVHDAAQPRRAQASIGKSL